MRLFSSGTFLLRHLIAVPAITLMLCGMWICLYVALLVIAIFSNSAPGGPLALPAGLLFIALTGMVLGWGIFVPACALGAAFCGVFRLPKFAAIPVVWLATCVLGCLAYLLFTQLSSASASPAVSSALLNSAIYLSLPVGIYWWLTEGPAALVNFAKRSWLHFNS